MKDKEKSQNKIDTKEDERRDHMKIHKDKRGEAERRTKGDIRCDETFVGTRKDMREEEKRIGEKRKRGELQMEWDSCNE